jgi:hypothetical protein
MLDGSVASAMYCALRPRLAEECPMTNEPLATWKPRADCDRVASNENRRKDWCREHSVGDPFYCRFADYLFVELEPVVADGIGGACRVRLWAAIFQSEPSLTITRIQLPVTVSPGFKFGLLR